MLKRLFHLLVVFAVISLACFVLVLFHNTNSFSFIVPKSKENRVFSWGAKRDVKQPWVEKIRAQKPSNDSERIPASVNRTLGPCPEAPPGLVGPLYVGFDFKKTLEDVRLLFNSSLQEGGRFKPKDCIANQKVGE